MGLGPVQSAALRDLGQVADHLSLSFPAGQRRTVRGVGSTA